MNFSFVNNTKETILITNVRPACGCTAANYTKTPIKPGEKGMVAATFDAKSPAPFHKTVTIMTNEGGVESVKTLSFKGKVIDTTAEQKSKYQITILLIQLFYISKKPTVHSVGFFIFTKW